MSKKTIATLIYLFLIVSATVLFYHIYELTKDVENGIIACVCAYTIYFVTITYEYALSKKHK